MVSLSLLCCVTGVRASAVTGSVPACKGASSDRTVAAVQACQPRLDAIIGTMVLHTQPPVCTQSMVSVTGAGQDDPIVAFSLYGHPNASDARWHDKTWAFKEHGPISMLELYKAWFYDGIWCVRVTCTVMHSMAVSACQEMVSAVSAALSLALQQFD